MSNKSKSERWLSASTLVGLSLLALTGSIQSTGGPVFWNYVAKAVVAASGHIVKVQSLSRHITN